MINFNIDQMYETINDLNSFSDALKSFYYSAMDLYNSYIDAVKRAIDNTKTYIDIAERDIVLIGDAQYTNNIARTDIQISIDRLYSELKSLDRESPSYSVDSGAISSQIDKLETLRSRIDNYNRNLDSLRTNVSLSIDKLKHQLSNLKKVLEELESKYYKVTDIDKAAKEIASYASKAERAKNCVEGVFTSCKVESVNVLQNFKSDLAEKNKSLREFLNDFDDHLLYFTSGILNAEFVHEVDRTGHNSIYELSVYRNELNSKINKLENYINVLDKYIRSV